MFPCLKLLLIVSKPVFESGKLRNFFVVNVLFSQSGSSAVPPVVSVFIGDSRMPLTSCHEPGSSPHGRGDIPWPSGHRSFQGGCYFHSLPALATAHHMLVIPQATWLCLAARWSHTTLNHRAICEALNKSSNRM